MPLVETYDLPELSRAAGVTPRTVRYYVAQGLLPSPGTRGPGARYERGHLDRLQLIKRLQREHLPLAEIRRRLEQMDDGDVRSALGAAERVTESSALEYVRSVLAGGGPAARPTLASMSMAPMPEASLREAMSSSPAAPMVPMPSKSEAVARDRSQWERIALTPDVELHVRRPLSRVQNKLVERLIELARRALEEDAP
ncbi:MAG TPA: MerR family transcriptional regulator [Gemmatimonadaceae bacterium]|nr:MerR family transcriptional regulator [Gemmatimonadaceae bacterium]